MSVMHIVIEDYAGQRLDNYLLRELKKIPRSRVYQMVRRGEVRVNGGRVGVSYRLQRGDRLRLPPVRIDSRKESHIGEQTINQIRQAIIYEDEELLVLNKPAGIAAHGGSGIRHGVIEILRQTQPEVSFELAHRLDRDTSGCMLIAKTRGTLLGLHTAFREARVRKRYDAVVAGHWPRGLRTVRHSLRRYMLRSGERRVRVDLHGDRARTDFEVQQRGATATRLWVYPHTGRTHQIRVHVANEGHAVLGDDKYQQSGPNFPRLMLHSSSLKLPDGRRFNAKPDTSFLDTWGRLLEERN